MLLTVNMTMEPKRLQDESKLGFGSVFTDHMFNMDYDPDFGWHSPRIEPYAPLTLDPASMMFHYAQGVFEGLKAYRRKDGKVQMFRPRDNLRRMNRSCRRLCIPEFDEDFVLGAMKDLIRIDRHWVPSAPGTSLYIRPVIIATDPFLGVRASSTYRFFIILSPVGAYYAEGFTPVNIWVTDEYVRAVKGGVGETKTGGNYAASIFAGEAAKEEGYAQVMWLDALERRYIEEVGAMNIFFVLENQSLGKQLITPELSGSILPGITRDSVLALARSWNWNVLEKRIDINDIMDAAESGVVKEAFGTGTAAVISPVGEIRFRGRTISINEGETGPMARDLYNALTDIQCGCKPGPKGWIDPVWPPPDNRSATPS